jgi:activating signal cointegrator 1
MLEDLKLLTNGAPVKALSLWEPWASLIMTGAKTIETRSWYTGYRGPLLICAAKGGLSKSNLVDCLDDPVIQKGLAPLKGAPSYIGNQEALRSSTTKSVPLVGPENLHFGHAVALVKLQSCLKTNCLPLKRWELEKDYGDFHPGRYAWVTSDTIPIDFPLPVKGMQGLFEVKL